MISILSAFNISAICTHGNIWIIYQALSRQIKVKILVFEQKIISQAYNQL